VTGKPHVLVAEDNQLVCEAMQVLFGETGHRVSVAGHVAEIVDIAESDPVDLLLLDLALADGDGFEVLAVLRERKVVPRFIVGLTGRDEPDIIARLRQEGCAAVLMKPVPARELLRVAAELLGN
jgi:two-component system, OmpR family, response regulator